VIENHKKRHVEMKEILT